MKRGIEAFKRIAGIVKVRVAVIQRAAVMRPDDKKAHRFGVVFGQDLADGEEIAQRLGHLFVVHTHKTVVHPDAGQGLVIGAFGLRDFIFMVRKLQISTAAVNIKRFAEQLAGHGRALDMPAGTTRPVGTVPFGIVRLGRFGALPEHEVQRVVFAVKHIDALSGAQLVQRFARQLAVACKFAHGVIDVALAASSLRLISQSFLLQRTDQGQHLRHELGGTRLVGGALNAQRVGVLVQGHDHAVRQGANGLAVFNRTADDLVVDIGDVAHIGDLQATGFEPALHHVKRHHRPGMAQMAEVINRHPADIHADMPRHKWRKILYCTRQRVVNPKAHEGYGYVTGLETVRDGLNTSVRQ